MKETPTKGKKGWLLYNPFNNQYFFRIYNPEDRSKYTDYKLCFEDLEIEIIDNYTSLYESEDGKKRVDYSSKVLGRKDAP